MEQESTYSLGRLSEDDEDADSDEEEQNQSPPTLTPGDKPALNDSSLKTIMEHESTHFLAALFEDDEAAISQWEEQSRDRSSLTPSGDKSELIIIPDIAFIASQLVLLTNILGQLSDDNRIRPSPREWIQLIKKLEAEAEKYAGILEDVKKMNLLHPDGDSDDIGRCLQSCWNEWIEAKEAIDMFMRTYFDRRQDGGFKEAILRLAEIDELEHVHYMFNNFKQTVRVLEIMSTGNLIRRLQIQQAGEVTAPSTQTVLQALVAKQEETDTAVKAILKELVKQANRFSPGASAYLEEKLQPKEDFRAWQVDSANPFAFTATILPPHEHDEQPALARGRLDSGCEDNWLSADIVQRVRMSHFVEELEWTPTYTGFNGAEFQASGKIEVTWYAANAGMSRKTMFFVLEEGPFDMILGHKFIVAESIFVFDKPALIGVLKQSKLTKEEEHKMEENLRRTGASNKRINELRQARTAAARERQREEKAASRASSAMATPMRSSAFSLAGPTRRTSIAASMMSPGSSSASPSTHAVSATEVVSEPTSAVQGPVRPTSDASQAMGRRGS